MPSDRGFFAQRFGNRKGSGMGWMHGAQSEKHGAKGNKRRARSKRARRFRLTCAWRATLRRGRQRTTACLAVASLALVFRAAFMRTRKRCRRVLMVCHLAKKDVTEHVPPSLGINPLDSSERGTAVKPAVAPASRDSFLTSCSLSLAACFLECCSASQPWQQASATSQQPTLIATDTLVGVA